MATRAMANSVAMGSALLQPCSPRHLTQWSPLSCHALQRTSLIEIFLVVGSPWLRALRRQLDS